MKKLYLLRHAKSSWDSKGIDDIDRTLNTRGENEARLMAEYFEEKGYNPDTIICSTAKRAKETLKPILKKIDYKGNLYYDEDVYYASAEELKELINSIDVKSLMIVGHNPTLELLLSNLISEPIEMKTCQLAIIDLTKLELLEFIRGKEL